MINKSKLIAYLQDLVNMYSPVGVDIAGRWIGGDEKLWMFCKKLVEEVSRWPDDNR